ncbi:MAG: phage tail protein, partial [Terriglobia bacterium]
VALTASQLPSHSHSANCANAVNVGSQASPVGNYWSTDAGGNTGAYNNASDGKQLAPGAVAAAGGGQPHDNMQPFVAINYIIALNGIFPSRS